MLSIRRLFYLLLVTCAAFAAHACSCNPQSYWLVLSALILSLITIGDTFSRRVFAITLTGVACTLSVLISGIISGVPIIQAVFLALLTVGCVYVGQYFSRYFLLFLTINLFALVSGTMPASLPQVTDRMMFVFCGMVIAIFFQIVFLPGFLRHELRSWLRKALLRLAATNQEIFSSFLRAEYANNLYLFEKRIHVQKNKYMQTMEALREVASQASAALKHEEARVLKKLLDELDYIYSIILDCAQLRRRVSDYTIFNLCYNEMTAIAQEINKLVLAVISVYAYQNNQIDVLALAVKIRHLEDNYQNVLQVTAREPLVFLLFIASLKILNEELVKLYEEANIVREVMDLT